jgi:hypothetical protein
MGRIEISSALMPRRGNQERVGRVFGIASHHGGRAPLEFERWPRRL